MSKSCALTDVRQIGPGSERQISGVCSACGTTLLARLNDKDEPNRDQLEARLKKVFDDHLARDHGHPQR